MSAPAVSHLHFCTYFDRNYLSRAVALYRSLEAYTDDFTLWAMCCDEDSRRWIARLGLARVNAFPQADLERADPDLAASRKGRSVVEHYWTSTPCLPLYLLETHDLDLVTYLDADLFFFSSARRLRDALGERSVLAFRHDFSPGLEGLVESGVFNVGALAFRNDDAGKACLRRWREQCLEWCYDRHEPGRYGDQVYLDEWPARYGDKLAVPDDPGLALGPWNIAKHRITRARDGRIESDGVPVVFFHYHGLSMVRPDMFLVRQYHTPRALRRHIYRPYACAHASAWHEIRARVRGFRAGLVRATPRQWASALKRGGVVVGWSTSARTGATSGQAESLR